MVSINTESLTIAFVVAISKSKIEGILPSAGSIVSKSFWIFLGEMAEATKSEDKSVEQTFFIFDNVSPHHSKEFLKFSKERRIRCLTIPPYFSSTQPCGEDNSCNKGKNERIMAKFKYNEFGNSKENSWFNQFRNMSKMLQIKRHGNI